MVPEKNQTEQLQLLPMPLSPQQKLHKYELLKEKLKTATLDQIVEIQLSQIYGWREIEHLPTRRLYRNYTLIYSNTELKNWLLLSFKQILLTESPDNNRK